MPSPTPLIVVGHRGCAGYEPENTLASFRRAIELGAQWVELDVHVSKDGIPMVIHDASLSRTTSLSGKVSNCLSNTMQTPCIDGIHHVPRLSDVLQLLDHHDVRAYVEIKEKRCHMLPVIMRCISYAKHGHKVSSFDKALLQYLRAHWPFQPLQVLFHSYSPRIKISVHALDANEIGIRFDAITHKNIALLLGCELPIFAYTVNDARQMRQCENWGLTGVYSDYPDLTPTQNQLA